MPCLPSADRGHREEILRIALSLDRAGFMPSKSGNVSCRTGDGMLITPAGVPYARTTPEDLVEVGPAGKVRSGQQRPSSEWRLHAAIYAARPEVDAVVHTHSPKATALSCCRTTLPCFHYVIAMFGGAIRCSEYRTCGTAALGQAVVQSLAGRRAALIANHGVVTVGPSLAVAETLALEVENLAGEYLALLASGLKPVLLSEAEMAEVTATFAAYGRLT
jgi:L-fuculose-phosphate aldolase